MSQVSTFYVGLDYHHKTSSLCILDNAGKLVKRCCVKGSWIDLIHTLAALQKELGGARDGWAVCFEASCGYGHLHDQLVKRFGRVEVAHPGQLRLIFRSKKKSDRVDAEKIAKLLYLDQVPKVHVPDVNVRAWRMLIEHRRRLVARRTQLKNGLRALLRTHGLVAPKRLWSKRGLVWIESQELPTSADVFSRRVLLEELRAVHLLVSQAEHELHKISSKHPGVALLMTAPGVGPRTAEAVMAYVDQPERFKNQRQIGAYFGLVPCQDSSAGVNRLGHITKNGPSVVRMLLTEAAWQGIRHNAHLKSYFERIRRDRPDRRKIALVATAHHLLRCLLSMLKSGEVWRWNDPIERSDPLLDQPGDADDEQKDGCAGGESSRLTHCASSGRGAKGSGPSARASDRPGDRRTIHVGAPVARQQSRILRVDETEHNRPHAHAATRA